MKNLESSFRVLRVLHVAKDLFNQDGFYHLPFKAIFEIEKLYPQAYSVVIEYRTWLINEVYKLLLTVKTTASMKDAHMFLFVIDGAMVQLLSKNSVDERDKLLEYFLIMLS